ncbi:MAG: IPT/TIG domain-containing protein [Acidimicrobiales bacterium]
MAFKLRLRSRVFRPLSAGLFLAAACATPLLVAGPASAGELSQKVTSEANMVDVAFDSAGNLYESEASGNVNVWPVSSGVLFGQTVTAGQANTLATLNNVPGIAFDAQGDLFMANDDGPTGGSISVLPAESGTIFGQDVTADTLSTVLSGLDNPIGLAFDSEGNLYYATQNDISVLPADSETIFGQSVSADVPETLVSGLTEGGFLAIDSSQNLYYTDIGNSEQGAASVNVLPQSTGSIFGQSVTADSPQALVSGLDVAAGLAFDNAGNLYVDYKGNVGVLSDGTGTVDGTSVDADTFTQVATGLFGDLGSTSYDGNIYIADQLLDSVDELTAPTAAIGSVTFGGTPTDPVVFVTGRGFNTSPPVYPLVTDETTCSPGYTGSDYRYGNLYLADTSGGWGAGVPADCVGVNIVSLTGTEAIYTLGSFLTAGDFSLESGDSFTIGVDGATYSGTVSFTSPSSVDITKVAPSSGPGAGNSVIKIKGTNFQGTEYVLFGTVPAENFEVNARGTKLTTISPPGSGTVDVTLVNADDQVSTQISSDEFVYLPPSITSLSPTKGPPGGETTVTITGTDFQGATAVMFGSTPAASFQVFTGGTEIQAVSPAGNVGKVLVTVTTPGGTSAGVKFKYKS